MSVQIAASALARRGLVPAPTYVGIYADGSRRRMSFWSLKGKPYDCESTRAWMESRGRLVGGWIDPAGVAGLSMLPARGAMAEYERIAAPPEKFRPAGLVADPHFSGEPVAKTAKRNYRATLVDLLAWLDGSRLVDDGVVGRARDLVA